MTSKAMEEAIERAAAGMANEDPAYTGTWPGAPQWRWDAMDDQSRAYWRRKAEAGLRVAFPSLFDGTAWIAPWEATEEIVGSASTRLEMFRDGGHASVGLETTVARDVFSAIRDAYLNAEQPLDPDAGLPTPEDVRGILKDVPTAKDT